MKKVVVILLTVLMWIGFGFSFAYGFGVCGVFACYITNTNDGDSNGEDDEGGGWDDGPHDDDDDPPPPGPSGVGIDDPRRCGFTPPPFCRGILSTIKNSRARSGVLLFVD